MQRPWRLKSATPITRNDITTSPNGHTYVLCGLLSLLTCLGSWLPAFNILAIAVLYTSIRYITRQHGRLLSFLYVSIASISGHIISNLDQTLNTNMLRIIDSAGGQLLVISVHVVTFYSYQAITRDLEATQNRDKVLKILFDLSFLGLMWTSGCELLSYFYGHDYTLLSSDAAIYPRILSGNVLPHFLDAIFAYGISAQLEALLLSRVLPRRGCAILAGEHEDSTQKCRADSDLLYTVSSLLAVILVVMWLVVLLTRHSIASTIRIGCTNPTGFTSNETVIEQVRQEMAYVDVLVLPATANYITDVNEFLNFKKRLTQIIDGQLVSVIFPTQDFRTESACQGRYNLQVYNLGEDEKTTMNTYTHKIFKARDGLTYYNIKLQSLFRTWVTLRVQDRFGRLMMASAICIESDFPNVFNRRELGPDLLIVPGSSWTKSAPGDRIKAMTVLAIRKSTNILYCDDNESAYIDSSGMLTYQSGPDSFSVSYDLLDKGALGYCIGLWWVVIPLSIVGIYIVQVYVVRSAATDE